MTRQDTPKSKNDDSVQARLLKMSRFDPPESEPVPKCKNDDSTQGGPFKMSRFGPRTSVATCTTTGTTSTSDTAPPKQRPSQQFQRHGAAQTTS